MISLPGNVTDSRSCPPRDPNEPKISLYLLTWNVMGGRPQGVEEALQFETKGRKDVYGIALQETPTNLFGDEWKTELDRIFNVQNYVRLHSFRPVLLGIQTVLAVYVRREDITKFFDFSYDYKWLNIGGKASIGVRFYFSNLSFCFVGSHFDAHDYNLRKRIANYQDTVKTIEFDSNKSFFANKGPKDGIFKQDLIFWFGDLNFRLDDLPSHWTFDDVVYRARTQRYKELLFYDQLSQKMTKNEVFEDFQEEEIKFAPTFKLYPKTDNDEPDDYNPKRTPSYTDRILHRNNLLLKARKNFRLREHCEDNFKYQVVEYNSLDIRWSDHRPVYAIVHVPTAIDNQARKMRYKSYRRKRAIVNYLRNSAHIHEPTMSPARSLSIEFVPINTWWLRNNQNPLVAYFNIKDKVSNDLLTATDPKVQKALSHWDWVGLYNEKFASIEDYITFAYPKFEGWVEQGQDAMDLLNQSTTTSITSEEDNSLTGSAGSSRRGSAEERRRTFGKSSTPSLPTSVERPDPFSLTAASAARPEEVLAAEQLEAAKYPQQDSGISTLYSSSSVVEKAEEALPSTSMAKDDLEQMKTEGTLLLPPPPPSSSLSRSPSISSLSSITSNASSLSNDSRASTRSIGEGNTNLFSAMFDDNTVILPGRYVLLYIRTNGDVLGVSEPFEVAEDESSSSAANIQENRAHRGD